MLPLAYARLWAAASAALIVVVIYGSLGAGMQVPGLFGFDKLQHFGTYCVLAVWFTGLVSRRNYWKAALALVCLGLGMELLQQSMGRGRIGEPLDMAANALGVAAGVAVALWQTGGWARRIEAWLVRN